MHLFKIIFQIFLLISLLILFTFIETKGTEISKNSDTKLDSNNNEIQQTIAIIGGGVGGSSAAYFLKQLLDSSETNNFSIDLFEKSSEIGGRLATRPINGKLYETGGSIIHNRNLYAIDLVNELKLSKRRAISESEKLCIFDGKSYVFCESNWKWITYFKIWLRYGFDVNRLMSKVSQMMDDFEKIYELQDNKVTFDSVDELLNAMSPSILNLTRITYKDYLFDSKFSKTFINELVQSIALVNYGQDLSIPAFVGTVSFAGAGSHLWSINGGNNQLPKKLAINSNANVLLNTYVNSIKYLGPNSFEISATKKSGQSLTKVYNSVIIATPLDENQIDFINFSINLNQNKPIRKYHRTVSTLVAGTLNKKFKGRDVLTDNKNVFFTSIGRLHAVDGTSDENVPVYKVFSQLPLSTEQLNTIFEDIQVVDTTDWLAYPHYDSILLPLPKFILFPGIYHVNAIEWAASAIEMSLIGGKNAALLTFNQMGGKTSNVYSEKAKKQISDEL